MDLNIHKPLAIHNKAQDCKSAGSAFEGSNPSPTTTFQTSNIPFIYSIEIDIDKICTLLQYFGTRWHKEGDCPHTLVDITVDSEPSRPIVCWA